jgi:hypothetical protein
MTNFTKRLMVAAATLVASAGAASAQTMKAEIPFTFRANGELMTPGTYRVTLTSMGAGVPYLYVHNLDGHHSALAVARVPHDAPKGWRDAGNAVLSFKCGAKVCTLVEVWGGNQAPAYSISSPRLGKDEPTRIALVALRPEKGD